MCSPIQLTRASQRWFLQGLVIKKKKAKLRPNTLFLLNFFYANFHHGKMIIDFD